MVKQVTHLTKTMFVGHLTKENAMIPTVVRSIVAPIVENGDMDYMYVAKERNQVVVLINMIVKEEHQTVM